MIIDRAVIGENSIVGASAFVKANAEMPANHLIIGSPAKRFAPLSEQELAWKQGTREYQALVERCKQTLHQVEPLREVEAGGVSGWRLMKPAAKAATRGKIACAEENYPRTVLRCGGVYRGTQAGGFNTVRRCNCSYSSRMRGAVARSLRRVQE